MDRLKALSWEEILKEMKVEWLPHGWEEETFRELKRRRMRDAESFRDWTVHVERLNTILRGMLICMQSLTYLCGAPAYLHAFLPTCMVSITQTVFHLLVYNALTYLHSVLPTCTFMLHLLAYLLA